MPLYAEYEGIIPGFYALDYPVGRGRRSRESLADFLYGLVVIAFDGKSAFSNYSRELASGGYRYRVLRPLFVS